MSDATAAGEFAGTIEIGKRGTPHEPAESIDAVLADFRDWLTRQSSEPPPPAPSFDLATLVSQFTALRHEVNLQTKTTRSAVEQTATILQQLQSARTETEPDHESERPFVKLLLDIQDALMVAKRQVEKSVTSVVALLPDPNLPQLKRPGFLARLFGAETLSIYTPISSDELKKLRQQLAAVADGYAMSLRRIEAALPQFGLEAILCDGQAFNPELMEVVDTIPGSGKSVGTVLEVLRIGYRWRGKLLRYAQVKVAT